ncbi:MAG TPA: trypsin-like peptidase domain-containing protein [Pyrinomonadaceae bacterium]|nr:trypsin-like peptidase domain-containing protein [Pyrinomonadaceae bacterium]
MAAGIIIHISIGTEKRTEFFSDDNIRIGSSALCDLQIHTKKLEKESVWLEIENNEGVYRVINFDISLDLKLNQTSIRRFVAVGDGDSISIGDTDISFSFFSLASKSALITTNREQPHLAQFIETAALESAASEKRDDAKVFLREFVRELFREISITSKLIALVLIAGFLTGILYLGFAVNKELRASRQQSEQQGEIIRKLEEKLGQTSDQLGELDKTNKDLLKTVSLAPNLRVEYGNGVCLIVGVYDLVDKKSGKVLRYPDPQAFQPNPYEPQPMEGEMPQQVTPQAGLTTEGNGSPVEYDFIGTGFHVGSGYIVTNRHVLQPWEEDDLVKQMMREADGRARIKRLVIYFPNIPQPFNLKIRQISYQEDVAVASIDTAGLSTNIPVLPLEDDANSVAVGKTVVTMGYPNGPDRLLAMVDDAEAKSINARFGGSRQALVNFLAQSKKIVPLTTQGAVTDLDSRRIVHDAKTAEGGSGAPLFGQTGKVIGVNFGVFTESNAANMAIPISFARDLLKKAGWKSPEELKQESNQQTQIADAQPSPEKGSKAQ